MEEIAFNLEALMTLNCDYVLLKRVLEYLLGRDKAMTAQLLGLEKNLDVLKDDAAQAKAMPRTSPSMPEFIGLKQKVEKLEERVYSHDARFAEHQTIIDTTNFNMKMMQMTINEHEEKIQELLKLKEQLEAMQRQFELAMANSQVVKTETIVREKGSVNVTGTSISDLESLKRSLLESLASKDDLALLTGRVSSLEAVTSDLSKEQDKTNKEVERLAERLKVLESQLLDKVSCEQYDKLIALVNQLRAGNTKDSAPIGPIVSSKDINLIKEVAGKVADLEARLKILSNTVLDHGDAIDKLNEQMKLKADKTVVIGIKETLDETRDRVQELSQETSSNTAQIEELKKIISLLEVRLAELSKELNRVKGGQVKGNVVQTSSMDSEELRKLKEAIAQLRTEMNTVFKELEELKGLKDLRKYLHELEIALEGKLDKEEFERWKAENDLNQLLNGILKKFADRNEMMKLIKRLEARIALLEEAMQEGNQGDLGENALLAKKPLGGWSCASCQKDLVNIEGLKVQYYPWARLPMRNPAERIAKVGQGFSRMLSMLKPEMITKSQQFGTASRKNWEEEPIEEIPAGMAKTHGQGFATDADGRRPNSVHMFPKIQQKK